VRLVSDERLLDIAEQFVGPDIALFASHYICKPAGSGRPVLWHQDGAHWPLEPMEVVTLWLAINDSTPENGGLRVIHPRIMHGSGANTSPMRRCGLTTRYIPTSTRITASEQPYPSAILLRGKPGMNVYQPWPAEDPEQRFALRPG
jgi:ectoine hydroxylase-related dioxygenase (phytanoyl-CoA dioxygenase family)